MAKDKDKEVKVIDDRKRIEVESKLKQNEWKLNDACMHLKHIDDFFPVDTVDGLQMISSNWLRSYIDGVEASVNDDKRLTRTFKKEIAEHWEETFEKASSWCDKVALIVGFKDVPLLKTDNGFEYDPKKLKTFAEKEAKVVLTPSQKEYLQVLKEACAGLNKVKEYEESHNLTHVLTGAAFPTGKGSYEHVDFLSLINPNGEGKYDVTPETFVYMIQDGIIGVQR